MSRFKSKKAFYNLTRRRDQALTPIDYERGMWSLIGAPGEQSTFSPKEAVLKISLFGSRVQSAFENDGHDYVDLSYQYQPGLPRFYGGLSGSGVWRTLLNRSASTGLVTWTGEAILEGVAFCQLETSDEGGVLRCHGRRSIFKHAFDSQPSSPLDEQST